jgi:hypothetical protein
MLQKGEKYRRLTNSGYNTCIYENVTMKHLYNYNKQTKNVIFFLLQNQKTGGKTGPIWWLVPVRGGRIWEKGVGG